MVTKEKKPMSKKKKIALILVAVLLTLILSAVIAGVIFYNRMLNNLNRIENVPVAKETVPMDATVSAEDPAVETTLNPYDFEVMFPGEEPIGGDIINIMLVGQDTRDKEQQERGLSDTMILVSVNPATQKDRKSVV